METYRLGIKQGKRRRRRRKEGKLIRRRLITSEARINFKLLHFSRGNNLNLNKETKNMNDVEIKVHTHVTAALSYMSCESGLSGSTRTSVTPFR